jgi:predicted DNA-binding protein
MSDTGTAPRRRAAANFGAPALAPIQDIQPADPSPAPAEPAAQARPTAVAAVAPEPQTTDRGETSTTTKNPRRDAKPKTVRATATEVSGKADQPIQVSLPRSLKERLDRYKAERGLSHPTILFDAIETNVDRLPALVKERIVNVGATGAKSLFNRPQTVVRRDAATEPKETFIIRISQDNKDILEQLVEDTGAPSRNVLLVAAYEAFLPTE